MRSLLLLVAFPTTSLSLVPCEMIPFASSPRSCAFRYSTALHVRKLTKKSRSNLMNSGDVPVLSPPMLQPDAAAIQLKAKKEKKGLSPKQVTLFLRERVEQEGRELKKLWKDSDGLQTQIKGLEQGIAFIRLAAECFGRFIVDGKMDTILFTKPTPSSDAEEIETYRTLAAVKNDPTENMKNLLDKCLTRHGFRLEKVSCDAHNKDTFVVSLFLVPPAENEVSVVEEIVSASTADGDSGEESKRDFEATLRTTVASRKRKMEQDRDTDALRRRIRKAEELIELNDWRMKYIALAREAFARYYNDGQLEDIMFTSDTNSAVFLTLERLWEKSRMDRDIFNSCLAKHGLEYVKITYTEYNKVYYLTLGLLSQSKSEENELPALTDRLS